MTETEKAYVAGIIDGEGYINVRLRKSGYLDFRVVVTQVHLKQVIDYLSVIYPQGARSPDKLKRNGQIQLRYKWTLSGRENVVDFLAQIRPYLRGKQLQADHVFEIARMCNYHGSQKLSSRNHEDQVQLVRLMDQLREVKKVVV